MRLRSPTLVSLLVGSLSTGAMVLVACQSDVKHGPFAGLGGGGYGGGTISSSKSNSSSSSSSSSSSGSSSASTSDSSSASSSSSGSGDAGDTCTGPKDCSSGHCVDGGCAAATCSDGIKNGDESDKDCGKSCGVGCADLQHCNTKDDCKSSVCTGGVCQVPTCTDGVKNGKETDTDCGGGLCNGCHPGQTCSVRSDCIGPTATCGTSVGGFACTCPSGMVVVPLATIGKGVYCIDQKEVSYSDYAAFYNSNPAVSSDDVCSGWSKTFTPSDQWPAPPTADMGPVRYVNYCQAKAYCEWKQLHLCRSIGFQGGSVPFDDHSYKDVAVDQWYNACAAQGQNIYPYGNTYVPDRCNGAGASSDPKDPNGIFWFCVGGAVDLLEMSGNVAEWEDSCATTDAGSPENDLCRVRGGSYASPDSTALRCDADDSHPRNYQGPDVGFRCCL